MADDDFKNNLASVFYDGIGPLPMAMHSEEGDIMRRFNYEFPHRNDQDQEPGAVTSLVWSGEMLFLNGVEGYQNLWPQTFMRMKRRVRQPELGYLEHPLYGPVWGAFESFTASYTVQERNGCRVRFVYRRYAEDQPTQNWRSFDDFTVAASQAALADAGLQALAVPPVYQDGAAPSAKLVLLQATQPSLAAQVADFQSKLTQTAMTADAIAGELNRFRELVNERLAVPELQLLLNAELRTNILAVNAALTRAAADAQAAAARIINFPVSDLSAGPLGALDLAAKLYGDVTRAPEILALNPTELFEYPLNVVLRVADI